MCARLCVCVCVCLLLRKCDVTTIADEGQIDGINRIAMELRINECQILFVFSRGRWHRSLTPDEVMAREIRKKECFVFALILTATTVIQHGGSADDDFAPNFGTGPVPCPSGYRDHPPPLIILSMDGFRADYIFRGLTPTIEMLSRRGVMTPFMKPSYPSITFPNHYTLVTGLLPPYHGIVANRFFDPVFNATFRKGSKESFERRFWGGEPIWVTAEKQGKTAATFFWPGSETEGLRPTYWEKFNNSVPFSDRVNAVLQWLDLPKPQRPDLINFYLNEPDTQGHRHGPDSQQVNGALKRVDDTVLLLLEGLKARSLLSCVNLILLADHGMAAAGAERVIRLQEFLPGIDRDTRYFNGVFPRFQPLLQPTFQKEVEIMNQLSCKVPQMRVYHKRHLPTRWHLGAQRRVENIVLDLDAGFQVDFDGSYKPDEGDHGYDNIFYVMNALFLAHGPSFKNGVEVESFQNIELYNLLCALLGVTPAPNNGTWGALHHMLVNPPQIVDNLKAKLPPVAKLPGSRLSTRNRRLSTNENCENSMEESEESHDVTRYLLQGQRHFVSLLKHNLPWGVPQGHNKHRIKLLFHPNHVTGYSELLKAPMWVAFHLHEGDDESLEEETPHWIDDVRIPSKSLSIPSCNSAMSQRGFTWEPLFHPDFSQSMGSKQIPFLYSNAVPISKQLTTKWGQLRNVLKGWGRDYPGGINIVMGLAYDNDFDTLADDLTSQRSSSNRDNQPTHLYAVVTRCLGGGGVTCPPEYLDVQAFIFPQYLPISNCMSFQSFVREFSAKVDDVEKLSGFTFYPLMNLADRTRLKIRFHSNLWGFERWQNRIRSDIFGLRRKR